LSFKNFVTKLIYINFESITKLISQRFKRLPYKSLLKTKLMTIKNSFWGINLITDGIFEINFVTENLDYKSSDN